VKREDLHDLLCGEDGQPWPSEAMYDVEGLHYHELTKLCKMVERGEALPTYAELREVIREREANGFILAGPGSDAKGASKAYPLLVKAARRRAMAKSLGVTDPTEAAILAREAGTALDRVAVAAKRAGVSLDLGRGSRREVLTVAAEIYAANSPTGGCDTIPGRVASAVMEASLLIAEVDKLFGRKETKETKA